MLNKELLERKTRMKFFQNKSLTNFFVKPISHFKKVECSFRRKVKCRQRIFLSNFKFS